MLTTRRGLACLAFLVPPAALFGFAVVMARRIVKRGPKDYRRAELTDEGRRVRIDLDDYTKAPGEFGVFDPAAERYTRVGEITLIDVNQKFVERLIHPTGSGPATLGPVVDWTPTCSSSRLQCPDGLKRSASPPPTVRRPHGFSKVGTRTHG